MWSPDESTIGHIQAGVTQKLADIGLTRATGEATLRRRVDPTAFQVCSPDYASGEGNGQPLLLGLIRVIRKLPRLRLGLIRVVRKLSGGHRPF